MGFSGCEALAPSLSVCRLRSLCRAACAEPRRSASLRNGFVRAPSVAVEIETCRPFFILGEVAAPGQYSYVPNMTVESAVVIAGGFMPRALRDRVTDASGTGRFVVPPGTPISPGDTALTGERWF